jgi:hypothetical protein
LQNLALLITVNVKASALKRLLLPLSARHLAKVVSAFFLLCFRQHDKVSTELRPLFDNSYCVLFMQSR